MVWTCGALYILTWRCASPQRRALYRHRNLEKWSDAAVFCAFWLGHVLLSKSGPELRFCAHFDLEMTVAPQRRALILTSQFLNVVWTWGVLYTFDPERGFIKKTWETLSVYLVGGLPRQKMAHPFASFFPLSISFNLALGAVRFVHHHWNQKNPSKMSWCVGHPGNKSLHNGEFPKPKGKNCVRMFGCENWEESMIFPLRYSN